MQSRKDLAHIRMEKTNRPTMQVHKVRGFTRMEKIQHAIIQCRKDPAPSDGDSLLGWDRVPRKARAPRGHLQGQEVINYGVLL
jgi:hypothetical protein